MNWIIENWQALGVGAALGVPFIAWVWTKFLSREKTIMLGYNLTGKLLTAWRAWDIPVIGGKVEDTIKTRMKTTGGDFIYGCYCRFAGIDPKASPK